ncbi:MAG: protein kinase domain-containing protein [Bacteroidota bacterium]
MIGQTISHYKILEKLGEGGMGVVYKAQDTKLDRIVALKFLPHHLTTNEAEQARFLQEAKAASALNHPNVCSIHSIGEHEERNFIDMELVEGETLRQKVLVRVDGRPPLQVNDAIGYAIQIGEALHEAHSKGIVHRDIKCENIMVNTRNQIKVMDFGLAKLKGSLKLTKASSTVGTLAYMAPEQIQGGEVDGRSDIFSFGVVLFEMLTGKMPFRGEHDAAIMYSILNEESDAVQKYRQDASPELDRIIHRALEKDPADRYQHVDDMVSELRRLLKTSARVVRPEQGEQSRTHQTTNFPFESPGKSNAKWWIGATSAVVLAIVAWFLFFGKPPQAPLEAMEFSRLTSNGKVAEAVVSPDGKYLVYSREDAGKVSLWIRQMATGSNVQISSPAEEGLWGLTFSPDANFLYYNQWDKESKTHNVHQIPVLGGHPKKIMEDVAGPISLSPDGKRMVFYRWIVGTAEGRIIVAHLDGNGERILIRGKAPTYMSAPAWSPDGNSIAYAGGRNDSVNILTVPPEGGTEKQVSEKSWFGVEGLVWLADGSGLVLTSKSQIWQVAYPGGDAHRVTNDLNTYGRVSVTADRKMLVTVQSEILSNIWVLPGLETERAKKVSDDVSGGASWTPDGKIVYGSNASGRPEVWTIDADGSNTRQLTNDIQLGGTPRVSSDGRYIVFTSYRPPSSNVWRTEIDGSGLKQLSKSNYDGESVISPDGKWVIYGSAKDNFFLWKVSIEGGEPVRLTDKHSHSPAISPDGKFIACLIQQEEDGKGHKIAILSSEGGSPLKIIDKDVQFIWMPDGKALCYAEVNLGITNLFSLPLDGGPPKQLTNFKADLIFAFDWSKDGKQLLVVRGTVKNDAILITNF